MPYIQRTEFGQPFYDWDQCILSDKDDVPWIRQWSENCARDASLLDFLNIPAYSPRQRYQLPEFQNIRLDTELINIKNEKFSGSKLWLHDGDGQRTREYNGVISTQEAHRVLQLKRFNETGKPDALIRRFHLHHPTAESIAVLIWNMRSSEQSTLRDFFSSHIADFRNKASIRFRTNTNGRTFSMTFHLRSFVLTTVDPVTGPRLDDPMRKDGKRWRSSLDLSFLSKGVDENAEMVDYLHETRHSFTVHGHSKSIWASHCLVDTYFYEPDPVYPEFSDNEDRIEYYMDDSSDLEKWDPTMIGCIDPDKTMCDAREYFLMVLNKRCEQQYEQWCNTFTTVRKRISAFFEKYNRLFSHSPISRESAQKLAKAMQESRECHRQTEKLLLTLTDTLSNFIQAWKEFKDDGFTHLASSSKTWRMRQEIDDTFKDAKVVLQEIYQLKDECSQFGKDLKIDISLHSGSQIIFQYWSVTFVQRIAPFVSSATLIQAGIMKLDANLVGFVVLSAVLLFINWRVEPILSPLSRLPKWISGFRGPYKAKRAPGHLQQDEFVPVEMGELGRSLDSEATQENDNWSRDGWRFGSTNSWNLNREINMRV